MLFSYTFGCKECGHTWKAILEKGSKPPRCPNCSGQSQQNVSAPNINRGEATPGITIPQSQGRRETLAADLALKGTGMGDINSNMKVGDIAAKAPVRADPDAAKVGAAHLQPSFVGNAHEGYARAVADPYRSRNLGLIAGGNKLPRVERISERRLPTKPR